MWGVTLERAHTACRQSRLVRRRAASAVALAYLVRRNGRFIVGGSDADSLEAVAHIVRTKLDAGLLPREACLKTWFGRGLGRPCSACEREITGTDMECEGDFPDGTTLRFHRACYDVWDAERQRR